MLFTTTKVVILLSIFYHTWGNVNVALNKPATQSSTFGGTNTPYTADKAVNGLLSHNDFAHTIPGGLSKWWTVDLLARYSIERISLYNRPGYEYRLANISILTSTVLSPADPDPTHSDWTIRNYREEAYGSNGTVLFDSPMRAQHVAVYMENLGVPLALAEVEVSGVAVNLALNKPARQITTYEESSPTVYTADKAVNGDIYDFSYTEDNNGNKWWTVDLQARYSIESITLYNRQDRVDLQSRLAKISILTSTLPSPADPDPNHGNWTRRHYREEAYGSSGTVAFDPPIEAVHVAVYSENNSPALALAEVQVYENYNYASGKTASQSSTFRNRTNIVADKAIDGDFSTASITNFDQPNNAWWKVDLVDRILLREVTVYVRDGTCGTSNPRADCSSRLSDVYFLTNYRAAAAAPNTDRVAVWSICYHSETALGDNYTVQCDTGYQNPVTRLFSIRTNNGVSVELREVYVFGYALPELSGNIAIAADGITSSSITITFSQWNQQMTGGLPPTQYTVQLSGGESKTVVHTSGSQRLSTTFNGLDPWKTYTFTVSCTIQGIACTGSTHSFDVSTLCAVPNVPGAITLTEDSEERHNNRQMWKYNAVWVVPATANCPDVLKYQYNVTGQSPSTLQTDVTTTFYLDGNQTFQFVVRAKNSGGYSTPTSKNGISGVLKPQFTAGQVSVTGNSSTCVTVTWESPAYPGGTIFQYQYQCGSEGRQTVEDGIRSKDSCTYEPYTEVSCRVWATNSAGNGSIQNSGKSLCAAPLFTQQPTYTDVYDEVTNRRVVSIIVDTEKITINCDTLRLLYRLRNGELSADNTFRELEAHTTYEFTIRAINNKPLAFNLQVTATTGETKPDDGPVIAQNRTNSTCVFVRWTEPLRSNGEITEYRYKCVKKAVFPEWTTTKATSLTNCGYEAGSIVTCDIQASTSIGYGPSTTIDIEVMLCADPSPPVFNIASTLGETKTTVNLLINLQDSKPYCDSVTEYTIRIRHPDGSLVHNLTTNAGGDYIINNLYGFTNYTVTIEAVNNEGLRSESSQYIVTVETLPLDGPTLELSFTEDCVLLHLQPPQTPNGDIIHYLYWCSEADSQVKGGLPVLPEDLISGFVPKVCGLPQAIKIECDASAVNSVGEGPKSTVSGYTNAAVLSSTAPELLSPTQTNSELVVISIYPVELEDSTLQVSSYLVLLRNLTSNKVKKSAEEKCDVSRENCITIAKIDSELVTADGYWFYIGDGKLYGGYVNNALVPKSSYSVQTVISVQFPEGDVTIHQSLDGELSFTAPSRYCQPPPTIENAVAGSSSNATIGDTVLYACEYGYQTGGDNRLTCALTESYESDWVGSDVICDNGKSNWIVGVSAGIVGIIILAVGIAIVVVIMKKRNQPSTDTDNNPAESTYLSEYMPPPAAQASNYSEHSFGKQVNVSNPDDDCEYDTVTMDAKPGDEYETIPADASTSDHVYASC